MPETNERRELKAVRDKAEEFLRSLRHPALYEDGAEQFDLTAARWKFSIEFGKLLLEVWTSGRSIGRRVEEIAYTDHKRMGLFVRKPGAREASTLEFRELELASQRAKRAAGRAEARQMLAQLLGRQFRDWKIERLSNRSDREHSFSAHYVRGLARQGRTGWAFQGMDEGESPAAGDGMLAHGLIWLDWLRRRTERLTVPGLKLFLPPKAAHPTAERAGCLNRRAVTLEVFTWEGREPTAKPLDVADVGNLSTELVHHRRGEQLMETHRELVGRLLGNRIEDVAAFPDAVRNSLSLRVRGLEVARIEGQVAPRVFFGLEGAWRRLEEEGQESFLNFLDDVLRIRSAQSGKRDHPYFRLQPERWLESLLVRDISKIDPELAGEFVYPQVPAFSGSERGVIDILGVTRRGRLAVLELKLDEQISLPMQGLDYWLRVKWLADRGQFHEYGYFPGIELSPSPPLLFLVSPGFRFHSSTDRILRYLDPSIPIIKVGLNLAWRNGIRVLFRKESGRAETGFARNPMPE